MLETITNFDFITTLKNLWISATCKTKVFFTPYPGDWSPAAINEILERYGVKVLYWNTCNGELYFAVPEKQMQRAFAVLELYQVPLLNERTAEDETTTG